MDNKNIAEPTSKSKALTALQQLQRKHWERLNTCHVCHRTCGKHKKMDPKTFEESTYSINLMNCQHKGMKVCDICYEAGHCIIMAKYSKLEKKARKKAKVRALYKS